MSPFRRTPKQFPDAFGAAGIRLQGRVAAAPREPGNHCPGGPCRRRHHNKGKPMQLVENVLGNSNDPAWKARLADATIDTLELSQWDAQKNRLRKDTRNGQAIAVSLDRNAFLHDGDILLWDEKTKQAVICKIDLCEVPEAARRSAHRALRPARTCPRQPTLASHCTERLRVRAHGGEPPCHEFGHEHTSF